MAVSARFFHSAARFRQRRAISTRSNINAVPGPNPEGRYSRPLGSKPFFNMKERQPWQLKLTDDDYKPIWPVM